MMTLDDTKDLMVSKDYKERFIAEYWQTRIRYTKLMDMLVDYKAGKLNFEPSCDFDILNRQANHMRKYLFCLGVRAKIEGIDLGAVNVV